MPRNVYHPIPSHLNPHRRHTYDIFELRNLGGSTTTVSAAGRLDNKQSSAGLLDDLDFALGLSGRGGSSPSRAANATSNATASKVGKRLNSSSCM